MQNENEGNLAKRSRFHQGEMDVMSLLPGQDFEELPPVYVIFICTFDPFGEGFYRYTFKNMCQEKSFPLNDGAVRIFLNTKGCNESEVPEVLVNFLHYVENSTDTYVESLKDQTVSRIHERITQVKKSRRWERRYMKFEELLRNSAKKGWEDGHKKGEEAGWKAGEEAAKRPDGRPAKRPDGRPAKRLGGKPVKKPGGKPDWRLDWRLDAKPGRNKSSN